ncbi:hypothetical protein TVAG_098360 [Trichomonas vaginalis G3]|uniref:GOLD domain-containing protein n=1 Tax=Trichomonas vaginalis (strain ATCC PRA-98 / G3) TaxID=412133 RepID=A2ECB7_TRIV3|nr:hypothetical protein TVAGG3_0391400 [Trichomonas vaginalis G3]EAY09701.1 hypothetical protein TVAG_098360 [Trichomonas vaginalis G3]KAI5534024.1 hypothetical protein TVAGG3_0391400 [Trichomonas vaginalis G3]|eukprot:XP_001321924.1 hypothetical protein [Trichomonas vaginalis G3]
MFLNSNYIYPHSYIEATQDKSYKNYLIESTITGSQGYTGPIGHDHGENIVRNVNISNSQASSINSVYSISGNSDLDSTVSYSTFIKNIADDERCLLHYKNGNRVNHCNIISNECSMTSTYFNGVIYASYYVKVFITECIISNNKGNSLFFANIDASITVSSCFIPSNNIYSYYTTTTGGNANFDISITNSLYFNNSHISTALCYADYPFYYLMNITTEKTKYKIREDTTIKGTVSFDRNKEESFTLEIWIDSYSSTQLNKLSGSSTYEYSINIPSELSIGKHKIYCKFSDSRTFVSNTVSVEFEYLYTFSLELENLERKQYNKTIDKGIKIRGSGIYSEDFSINCSIGDINSIFDGTLTKNAATHSFTFSGSCFIPNSIVEENNYSVTVWGTTINSGETTSLQSKEFYFYRNYPVLEVTPLTTRRFIHNIDSIISVSGFVSDQDCDDIVVVYVFIDGYPNSQTQQSISTISIPDLEKHQFNISISIPNNLSRGSHNLLIKCCDKKDKCVSSNITFSYSFNAPILNITHKPAFPVFINQCHTLEFFLSVSDKDGMSYIRIFHVLNNTQGNIVNITLSNDSQHETQYFIPIPKDINVGSCSLKFYAVDEYDLISDHQFINATFEKYTQDELEEQRKKNNQKRMNFPPFFYILSTDLL